MGLSMSRRHDPDAVRPAAAFVTPERLCLDETKDVVVPCESSAARFLLAGADCEVSVADAARYQLALVDGRVVYGAEQPARGEQPARRARRKAVPAEPKRGRGKAVAGPPEDKGT